MKKVLIDYYGKKAEVSAEATGDLVNRTAEAIVKMVEERGEEKIEAAVRMIKLQSVSGAPCSLNFNAAVVYALVFSGQQISAPSSPREV